MLFSLTFIRADGNNKKIGLIKDGVQQRTVSDSEAAAFVRNETCAERGSDIRAVPGEARLLNSASVLGALHRDQPHPVSVHPLLAGPGGFQQLRVMRRRKTEEPP